MSEIGISKTTFILGIVIAIQVLPAKAGYEDFAGSLSPEWISCGQY